MKRDGKVRTACSLCQNFCGLFAYVQDGEVIKLEGDPENPRNHGHLCAKGLSGFINAYSPKRVRRPLLRMNPAKGLKVDPKWKEISWDEAIDIVANRLKKVKEKAESELGHELSSQPSSRLTKLNPWSQRILFDTFDHWTLYGGIHLAWLQSLDAYVCSLSASCFCGNAVHPPSYLNTSTFEITVDPEHSKYVLLVAAQAGSIIHYDTMNVARHLAQMRPNKIKVVAVDPMAGFAASKAEEWVPIRPGTDAAFALALVNLLINEYKIYDAPFLKEKTNAPYLVEEDGLYVREVQTGKPLVWDPSDAVAKTFDNPSVKDYALEGTYNTERKKCRPSFEVVKELVRNYTPERVSQITSISPDVIRRIAKEIGEAACIGQTIWIGGRELPYRPVSVVWYRGVSAHRHSFLTGLALMMLPTILGAIQVPGAIRGHPPAPERVSEDGLMISEPWFGPPYPAREVTRPKRMDLYELFPVAVYSTPMVPAVLNDPTKFGIDLDHFVWPEIMFIFRDNPVKNTYSPTEVVRGLSKIPFIVALNIDLDETANSLADIVFPDLHHLEKLGEGLFLRVNEPGYWYAAKPAVRPPFDPPWNKMVSNGEIFLAIAEKAGFISEVYNVINQNWKLKGSPFELDVRKKYSYQELVDRRLKTWLGEDKGLEWLMSDEGGLILKDEDVEEKYKGAFRKGRVHLYFEFMLGARKQLEEVLHELKLDWWDTSDYLAVPEWKPCPSYSNRDSEYNLFLINYKIPMMAHAVGRFNPIPMQLVSARSHLDSVLIHPDTAKNLGIADGDLILVSDRKGRKQKGMAHLSERVHPEVIASSQHEFKKGIDFNTFVQLEEDTLDYVSCGVDACILVKVEKVQPEIAE